MIGTQLDKYTVLQKVGEGGMATVYRGRHDTLDRDVAIKLLHPHLSSSSRNRKRFAREARAIECLRHDNILEIFDYSGIDSNDCWIITEFVEGRTLSLVLEVHGRLPSELVALIGIQLCSALGFAHAEGILHRDLKPENVMLRSDGRVKLMDFGIARFLNESQVTLTGALVGSPAFMSPEQAVEADLDQRSDLFSLGTVLFQLVTGTLPFPGSNPSLILKRIIEGERPDVSELCPDVSFGLAETIERLLSTDPDGRYPTAEAARLALTEALQEVAISPDDPRWSVERWLSDPAAYETDLASHLRHTLIRDGRAHLDAGEALPALRRFNRLLAFDEDNPEVLELVSSLHSEPSSTDRRRSLLWPAAAGLAMCFAGAVIWAVNTELSGELPPTVPTSAPPMEVWSTGGEVRPRRMTSAPTESKPIVIPGVRIVPPRTAPTLATAEPVEPVEPGTLRVRTNLSADVYLGDRRLGSTRVPIALKPGSYELEIRGDVVETRSLRVEVGPGEAVERELVLEARPAVVLVAERFADDCTLSVDGRPLGTLGALGRRFQVDNPDRVGHRAQIRCADGDGFDKTWSSVVLPGERIGR